MDEVYIRQEIGSIVYCLSCSAGKCYCGAEKQREALFALFVRLLADAKKEG